MTTTIAASPRGFTRMLARPAIPVPDTGTADIPTVNVGLVFDGPRIDRLEALWDTIGEFCQGQCRLCYTRNRPLKLSHAELFGQMWEAEKGRPNRFTVFTELDFLPALNTDWTMAAEAAKSGAALLACNYCTRHPDSGQLIRHPRLAGGWFLVLDKERLPAQLDFHGTPDPCNQLPEQLGQLKLPTALYAGADAYPTHYGIDYPMGTHLFWSRHLHDNPKAKVSGFVLGDIQRKHDLAVNRWVARQPPAFRALLTKRAASCISVSC